MDGDVLAIVVTSTAPFGAEQRSFQWIGDFGGTYTDGAAYTRGASWSTIGATYDSGFVTFVPESGYGAVTALVTLGVIGWSRARRADFKRMN